MTANNPRPRRVRQSAPSELRRSLRVFSEKERLSVRPQLLRVIALLPALVLAACATTVPACKQAGRWLSPATMGAVADPVAGEAAKPVVLLGEIHDRAEDHRWQLAVIRRLYAAHSNLVLGFEMFPRSDQKVLDSWVAGRLTEADFLAQSDWKTVWGFPPELYLPILRFARDHRVKMLALNVSHRLVHLAGTGGWAAVPLADREGVADPAPPGEDYRNSLADVMSGHGGPKMSAATLARFVDAQTVWDSAMAQAIAAQHLAAPEAPVVAIMGLGHLENRWGVPHQLASLGLPDAGVLLPTHDECSPPGAGYADALFTD